MQAATDIDQSTHDLGPLAWVLDELRKSLDSASAALRRFVRDAALARGQDMASVDAGQLRIARQQLHQAVGALEMVGLGAPALILRATESAVQKFVEHPELCSETAAAKVERAGFALTEYLEGVLLGKPLSAVVLFPQYRDAQEIAGGDRIHPADLWAFELRWLDPQTPAAAATMVYDPALRSRMDQAVLRIVKSADAAAARDMAEVSLGLAAGQEESQPRAFWKLAAGYFEALALGLLPADVYVKRVASRVLVQYATLAKGDPGVSDRLALDLLFFCAQALPPDEAQAPVLSAVRAAHGLARFRPVDYQTPQFGRFDPALLMLARKRIGAAKESWSAVSGGDVNKLKSATEQFHQIGDVIAKLHPASAPLAQSLGAVVDAVLRSGKPPRAEVAMEVATAVLYLEAAFQDLDPTDSQLALRTARLAERLDQVRQGGQAQALEPWMEELYRRVSDRQTMGSVVGELRSTLGELEKLLDAFFRNPQDKGPLGNAPGYLLQMRGVLSVLGLDQASQAVTRMREAVEEIIVTEVDEDMARKAGTFDKLGNNLGALGFLIDMLNYQPALAKKLFVYDDVRGELRPLMGRAEKPVPEAQAAAPAPVPEPALPAPVAETLGAAAVAAPAAVAGPAQEEDDELREIFLEEAREVIGNGLAAAQALAANPGDIGELTILRRAFHTLKGSSRMVGLDEFGEAGWALEQVLNTWLADQKPASEALRLLSAQALQGFGRWIEDIAARADGAWKAAMFRGPADTFRTEGRLPAFDLPGSTAIVIEVTEPPPDALADFPEVEVISLAAPAEPVESVEPIDFAEPEPQPPVSNEVDLPAAAAPPAPLSPEPAPVFEFNLEPVDQAPASPTPVAEDPLFATTQTLQVPVVPQESAPPELPADFELDFGSPVAPTEASRADPPASIEAIDFGSLEALSGPQPSAEVPLAPLDIAAFVEPPAPPSDIGIEAIGEPEPQQVPAAEPESWAPGFDTATIEGIEVAAADTGFAPEPEPGPEPDFGAPLPPVEPEAHLPDPRDEAVFDDAADHADETDDDSDDQTKVIDGLRIGIPLYNVYLNEADEWSRRLDHELGEWALQLNEPLPDSAVGLAHALAGSSATVGFHALSDVARALESSLQKAQALAWGTQQHGRTFVRAATEIRRLLHQFAAGFLKDADAAIFEALDALEELQVPRRAELPDSSRLGLDDFGFDSADGPRLGDAPDLDLVDAQAVPATGLPVPAAAAFEPPRATSAQPDGFGAGSDDDFDIADAIDPDLFPIFEEEALELLPRMGAALRQWAQQGSGNGRDEVLRALHTLKGSARLAGALQLGELAHRMESAVETVPAEASATDVDPLLQRFDNMQARFDGLRAGAVAEPPLSEAAAGQAPAQPQADGQGAVTVAASPSGTRAVLAVPVTTHLAPQRASAGQAVRVRSQLLDRLMNQAGEVMITRSRLENELGNLRGSLQDLTGNLDRLRSQLRDIELQAETQMQSRLALAKDSAAGFDPLEFDRFTRVQELTRMMAESVNDVATVQRNLQRTVEATEDDLIAQARQTRELQRDLLRTRMVEFEGISDRLYRVIRLASKETGKQVKLDITGGSIEMDRGVLDRMTPAFEHLLRNCVAHGIEPASLRTAAGKDPVGSILVDVRQEGNDVSVEFRDDGAGLDLARIREKALRLGLVTPGQHLSDAEAANLVFMPGFSTASEVTELAGRGIGMDVVRSEVNSLGGRIETGTQRGQGTSFRLVLPLTTAVTQVVMVRSGNQSIGVPANVVEIVRRAGSKEIQQAYNSGSYEFDGEQVPFFWSGALLQSSSRSTEPQARTLPVVVFRSAAQRVAMHVDEVLGNQEVVVKNLGPQLARLPGLAGMTVLASGAVVLIYNPVALSSVYGEQARRISADRAQPEMLEQVGGPAVPPEALPEVPQIPLVLVVDDSITVRRVTQRLLHREGYRVALAADGLQALERLAEERPAVVLSDIEMPRMDGFDLARNIRADARWAGLPIVMITSRIAEKHREHARELGVNHYLGKPYSEEELLSLVRHYCSATAAAPA